MKKDKYLRARGGWARIFDISCTTCGEWILRYQKDGIGKLLRCYLNRILAPDGRAALQHDPTIQEPKDMQNLVCPKCGTVIGSPMKHIDGRLAFRLIKGKYSKKISKGDQL